MAEYTKEDIEKTIQNLAVSTLITGRERRLYHAALKEYLDRHYPQPLSLDELKQMEGQPVWIINKHCIKDGKIYPGYGVWEVIDDLWYWEKYGDKFLFYRYQPEKEDI